MRRYFNRLQLVSVIVAAFLLFFSIQAGYAFSFSEFFKDLTRDKEKERQMQMLTEEAQRLTGMIEERYLDSIKAFEKWGPIDVNTVFEYEMMNSVAGNLKDLLGNTAPEELKNINLKFTSGGFMAQASANWMITKGILFGFSGLDSAGSTLESWVQYDSNGQITYIKEQTPVWYLAISDILGQYEMNRDQFIVGGANPNDPSSIESITESNYYSILTPTTVSQIENAVKTGEYAERVKDVKGISSDSPVYEMSLLVSRLLWCAIFVVQIVWVAYKMLIGGEDLSMLTTIFKGMFIFLSLFFIRTIAIIGLDFASAVGNAILGGTDVAHAVSDIGEIVKTKEMAVFAQGDGLISGMIAEGILKICSLVSQAVVYVMFILADVMMAITLVIGPWMIVLSMLPFCEDWVAHWIKSYVTFLFYRPLACLLCVLLYIIGLIGLDVGLIELMIICIVFIIAAVKVPSMAENMSGAAAAVGAGMTGMLSRGLRTGAALTGHGVGATLAGGARKLLSGSKTMPPME